VCYPGGVPSALAYGALVSCVAVACGNRTPPPHVKKEDAGAPTEAAVVDIPPRPLGLPDLASYGWRKRGGHPAFRAARVAEAQREWADVVTTCKQALAADPGNLEASWLLAAALGHLGKTAELVAPLQLAAAGDFGKWGFASLGLPALRAFLATPLGGAWHKRVETDRVAYIAALARSQILMSEGDIYGYDPETTRWYRLTRTFGVVIGALRVSSTKLIYVTRQRGAAKKPTLAVGIIDLATGKTSHPIALGTRGPITVSYASQKPDGGVWIATGHAWRRLDEQTFALTTITPTPKARPPGPWLEITKKSRPHLHAIPVAGVTADWDDKGLASAIRIAKSGRVVTVPAPGLIDGNTLTWSPDHARLAFVAQLDDQCTPDAVNAAAFVADATTGTVTEIDRADSLAIEWMTDRKLLIDSPGSVGARGDKSSVTIHDLDGAPPAALPGADGLLHPRRRPTCTPAPPDDLPVEPEPEPGIDPVEADTGLVEPSH